MTSSAFAVFERLLDQVAHVRAAAARELGGGHDTAPILLRSALVLAVAAFDTYVHERATALLCDRAAQSAADAAAVSSFLRQTTAADVTGPSAEGFVRYRLSYRTLVAPEKIDEVFDACGVDVTRLWLEASIAMGSRPDRVRALVQLQYDRRNQIAHEGDWDSVTLDFRSIHDPHVNDCTAHLTSLVSQFDRLL